MVGKSLCQFRKYHIAVHKNKSLCAGQVQRRRCRKRQLLNTVVLHKPALHQLERYSYTPGVQTRAVRRSPDICVNPENERAKHKSQSWDQARSKPPRERAAQFCTNVLGSRSKYLKILIERTYTLRRTVQNLCSNPENNLWLWMARSVERRGKQSMDIFARVTRRSIYCKQKPKHVRCGGEVATFLSHFRN